MIYKDALGRYTRSEWAGLTVYCMLLDGSASTYSPIVTHQFVDDLTPGSNELACTGYARQPVTLSAPTWDSSADKWQFLAGSVTFPSLGTGADQAGDVLFYEQVGASPVDSVDLLIAHFTKSAVTLDGTDFVVTVDSAGIYTAYEV